MKAFLFFIFVVTSVIGYRASNDEVISTTIKYYFEDIFLEHKSYDLMLGSSTIKRLNKYLACGSWLNRGIGNSTISNVNTYVEMTSLEITPKKILLYAGENDISRGIGLDETIGLYIKLIQKLFDKYPGSEIHAIAIKPSPNRREYWSEFTSFNNSIETYAEKLPRFYFHKHSHSQPEYNSQSFIDDGVHLTNQGYYIFTSGFNQKCKTK